jgi:hypothetical protein
VAAGASANGQRDAVPDLKAAHCGQTVSHTSLAAGAPDGRPRSRYWRHVTEI